MVDNDGIQYALEVVLLQEVYYVTVNEKNK